MSADIAAMTVVRVGERESARRAKKSIRSAKQTYVFHVTSYELRRVHVLTNWLRGARTALRANNENLSIALLVTTKSKVGRAGSVTRRPKWICAPQMRCAWVFTRILLVCEMYAVGILFGQHAL